MLPKLELGRRINLPPLPVGVGREERDFVLVSDVIETNCPHPARPSPRRPLPRGEGYLLAFDQLHPLVPPQESHLRQVPLRTRVKLPHSPQGSPS